MSLRIAAVDLNGQWRGKRLPASHRDKALSGAVRMPLSAAGLDVTGADPEGSPLVLPTGDVDGLMVPTGREVPMPWLARPATLIPASLAREDGTAFEADPRVALAAAVARWEARGLRPVAAVELEFALADPSAPLRPPPSPVTGRRIAAGDVLSLAALDEMAAFLDAVEDGAASLGLALEGMISEGAPGQMEVNLTHRDALGAADDAALLKLLVKGHRRGAGALGDLPGQALRGRAGQRDARPSVLRTGRPQRDRGDPAPRGGGAASPRCPTAPPSSRPTA